MDHPPGELFEGWRRGEQEAQARLTHRLWERLYGSLFAWLQAKGFPADWAHDLIEGAFWLTMEELDFMISGGVLLSDPPLDGSEGRRGKITRSELEMRQSLEWTGLHPFVAFAHREWTFRILDALHDARPSAVRPRQADGDV